MINATGDIMKSMACLEMSEANKGGSVYIVGYRGHGSCHILEVHDMQLEV